MKHPSAARALQEEPTYERDGFERPESTPTSRRSLRATRRHETTTGRVAPPDVAGSVLPDAGAADPQDADTAGAPGEIASAAEVMLAVETLTPMALLRLQRFARYRVRMLGARSHGMGEDDLLQEAVVASLAGQRRWRPRAVDFEGHLCGVMRSLSSHWAERHRSTVAMSEATERTLTGASGEGGDVATCFAAPTAALDPEAEVAARQELAVIRAHFEGDSVVLALIEALAIGLKGPEIKEHLVWSQTELETAMRRLRRGAARLEL